MAAIKKKVSTLHYSLVIISAKTHLATIGKTNLSVACRAPCGQNTEFVLEQVVRTVTAGLP